ncbi:GIY-YIG endonuclease [Pyrenophora seminiperda CCB06]|uniref:GIY-YIG endonuclease (Mitochondrion) n=1 Tax=Pyrenophora seminiperda CCB06 TaxID=1302712 RepID=A0A3M7M5E8_9PLEO|nr:GIY-YIG endonuclease [Pyrenophora seminiperda CCB06]
MKVEVTNVDTKQVTTYSSITAAARSIGIRQPSISLYLKDNRTKPFKIFVQISKLEYCGICRVFYPVTA